MTQWLIDTFVWTSVLIAAVLLLRRPVARHFGPQVAYALWALPLLRLVMPPVVLPASLAPVEVDPAATAVTVIVSDAPVAAAGLALTDLLQPVLLALWLGGALLFLVWRAADYLRMRRELLADARPVGEAGAVRLVETPEVASPVAFGLRDKVVALPVGFMAQHDLAARNLALAHELAHHRGHDLLANLAAQPLLALHWFNPLAWAGWRAMRSDQEAACDARVIAGCHSAERAAYAQLIATFAAGPRLALAAPMACPVLGEKSIIHRLRSLTMSDVSSTRRKAGLAVIATGALVALPLTASVSYAQDEEPAAASEPDRVIRFRLQREGEDGAAAEAEAGEPQIRRQMIIRRNGEEEVIEEGTNLAEAPTDGPHQTRQMVIIRHAVAPGDRPEASDRAFEAGCAEDEEETRSQNADGSTVTLICRQSVSQAAVPALRSAQRAIDNSVGLPLADRERMIRELEAEIEALEAEAISYAPGKPAATMLVQVNGVRVRMGLNPFAQDQSIILIPAAMLRLRVPVAPKVPQGELPI